MGSGWKAHHRSRRSAAIRRTWWRRWSTRIIRYPDGAVLFLGTMFAPVEDRDAPGKGFTHKSGDMVTIAAPKLGRLVNRMMPTDRCEAWSFGVGALMRNLAAGGYCKPPCHCERSEAICGCLCAHRMMGIASLRSQ